MRLSNQEIDRRLTDLLAEARALRLAVQKGALTHESAKERVQPLLAKINKVGAGIARKYNTKYLAIKFHDL